MEKISAFLQQELEGMNDIILDALGYNSHIRSIGDYIISAGGKRLRPIFALLSTKLFAYQGNYHLKVAAAIELIHTATLLHDDVVDNSSIRRGKATANSQWGNKYAVLIGDYLLSQAFQLMVAANSIRVLDIFSKSSSIISEGEVLQLAKIGRLDLSIEEYIEIVSKKTAELFAASCQVGAVLAQQDEETIQKMYNFGLKAGISFQIIDDLLDYIADEEELGKKLGEDFAEGKITMPILLLNQKITDSDKAKLVSLFEERTAEDFKDLLIFIEDYEIIKQVKDIARSYLDDSLALLDSLEIKDSQAKSLLHQLIITQADRVY